METLGLGRVRLAGLASGFVLLASVGSVPSALVAHAASGGAVVIPSTHNDVSPPLSLIPPAVQDTRQHEGPAHRHAGKQLPATGTTGVSATASTATPSLGASFEGVGQGFSGPQGTFTVNSAPPDPNGAVGPSYFVEVVNSGLAVFNKSGTPVFGPVGTNTLWNGFGGLCQQDNDGDATVKYDQFADRWVIQQLAITGVTTNFFICVAVSSTGDPTGSYNRYAFPFSNFPDYPKLSVWPDGYYLSINQFNSSGTTFLGPLVGAMDRSSMLAGRAATIQSFSLSSAYGSLLPSDVDGTTPPPSGSPAYFLSLDISSLDFWRLHVDWSNAANSWLGTSSSNAAPTQLAVSSYSTACGGVSCIPQLGTRTTLDALDDRLMYRLPYRNYGDHEALVANHSVNAGGFAGVRWYEVRSPAVTPVIYQSGTYAPDSNYRWMGSIAMDHSGDIALGFSVSSGSINPQVHYTGRVSTDPLGTMEGDQSIINGSGSQNARLHRWGDYTSMAVDPSDDCTFWYTNEYLSSNGSFNWQTKVGTFKFSNCTSTPSDFSITATNASAPQGGSGTSTVSTAVTAGSAQNIQLSATNLPSGTTASFAPNPVLAGQSSTLTLSPAFTTPAGSYTVTVSGTESGSNVTHTTTPTLQVTASDFSITANPSSLSIGQGGSGTSTISTSVTAGAAQNVSLSASQPASGITVSFNPTSVTAGSSSTMTVNVGNTVAPATYTITVTGTGATGTHTTSVTLTVIASDFSISANPSSLSIGQGASGTSMISTAVASGAAQNVSLAANSPASGITVSFNPTSVTAGNSSTMTVNVDASVATGTYTITVTGTGATGATHSTTITVTVTPPPPSDFSISATGASAPQGGSGTSTVSTSVTSGTAQTIQLSASGLPSGASASFNPTSVTAGNSSTLTLSAGFGVLPGNYTITVTGTGTSATHSTTLTLAVTSSDFTISASPSSLAIAQGSSGKSTINTSTSSGVAQNVNLSTGTLPSVVSATFNPTSVSSGGSSTMTVSVASTAPTGAYTITVIGTGQSANHSTSVTVNVVTPNPVVNGGFETGDLSGWTNVTPSHSAIVVGSTVTAPHSGNYSAQLGTTTPYNGNSTISQTVTIPSGNSRLNFWYQPHCPDTITYDQIQMQIQSTSGSVLATVLNVCSNSGVWTNVSYDTSAYAATSVVLWFNDHDDGFAGDPTYFFLDDVAINPYTPAPNVVQNPGFETGTFSGWTVATPSHAPVIVTSPVHSGSYAAQLGTTTAFNGNSTLTQTVTVPTGSPTLTFWYQPHCPDTITFDQIQMQIQSTAGAVLATVLNVCSNSGVWTQVSFDMTAYAGQTVVLWFNDHDDGFPTDPTYFYLDDVSVS